MASTLNLNPGNTGQHRVVLIFDETGSLQKVNLTYSAVVADRPKIQSDPTIVIDAADVPAAAKTALETMFKNKVTADSGITFA